MYSSVPSVSPSYNPSTTLSYLTEDDYSKHFKMTYQIFKKSSPPVQPTPAKPPPRPPRRPNFPLPETTAKPVFESRFSPLTIKTPPHSPPENQTPLSEGKNKGVMEGLEPTHAALPQYVADNYSNYSNSSESPNQVLSDYEPEDHYAMSLLYTWPHKLVQELQSLVPLLLKNYLLMNLQTNPLKSFTFQDPRKWNLICVLLRDHGLHLTMFHQKDGEIGSMKWKLD